MRNAGPRDARELVVGQRVAVVDLEQVEVDLPQYLGRDGPIALGQPVGLELVVGEHHLRVERRHDPVDRVLQ
jgi:hypothetical protein